MSAPWLVDEEQRSFRAEQREKILTLAADFPRVWNNPQLPHRERKRMVRLLLEDVTLSKEEKVIAQVRFKGGSLRTLELPVWSNYSCDATVKLEQSPEPLSTAERRSPEGLPLARSGKKEKIAFALMVALLMIMFRVLGQRPA